MPVVRMPDGQLVRFPDDMPPEHIKGLIASKFPEATQQASQGARLPIYTIGAPDGRKIKVQAADDATALRGAQEWAKSNPAQSISEIDRVAEGIRRAHAAGNADDVRALGTEYRRLQAQTGTSAEPLKINIQGHIVKVDPSFAKLSPADQDRTVDEIAQQMGIKAQGSTPDLARIKRNVAKMAAQNAPEADIDGYIASEGVTVDQVRDFRSQGGDGGSKLDQLRQQYPQYGDLSDQQLADAIHRKFYSDIPRERFFQQLGLPADDGLAAERFSRALSMPNWEPQQYSGGLENLSAGINDALTTVAGYPVDAARNALNWGVAGVNKLRGVDDLREGMIPDDGLLSKKWWTQRLQQVGVVDPERVVPANVLEKIIRAGGEGVGYAVAPEAVLASLSKAGIVGTRAQGVLKQVFGDARSARSTAANAFVGGFGGMGSQAAMEAAPDNLKPLAATLGGLGGAGVGTGITALPRLVSAGARMGADFLAPLTDNGRQVLAGRQLREGATSPGGALDAMGREPSRLVPGSLPTTGQLTGDMGILSMERGAATKAPDHFMQRRADQNAARLSAVGGMQPTGSAERVVSAVRSYLSDIDQQLAGSLDAATARARGVTADLGVGRSPDVAGSDLRSNYEGARAAAKARERALWQAVDPDGALSMPAASTRARSTQIVGEMPRTAKPQSVEEAAIFASARSLGRSARLSDITALQSRVKAEMRAERFANGESPAYRRLTQLNDAIQQDLEGAIFQKVAQEQRAVAAGQMRIEDTLEANFTRQREQWLASRTERAAGDGGGTSVGAHGRGGPPPVPGLSRAAGEAAGRPFSTPSNPGLSGDGIGGFDGAALGRLNAARTATRERVETFDNKTLGPMRRRASTTAPYDMPDAAVAQRLFFPGPKSFDAIQTYRRAVGDQQATAALTDYAVDRLRRVALRDDGTLDPSKLATWRRSHSDALRALPELNTRLGSAESASVAMGEAAASRRDILDAAQEGAVGRLIGLSDPGDVSRAIGSIFGRADATQQMFRLYSVVGSNPNAREGLRKAVVDHILDRFVSNTEAATTGFGTMRSDQFQTFVARNKGALRAAGFSDEEVKTFGRIAEDLRRSNRSNSAVRIPGQSNTAQDVLAARAGDTTTITLMKALLTAAASGGGAGFLINPFVGTAVGVGAGVIAVLRQNGIRKIDDLIREALLDPQVARALMVKASPGNANISRFSLAARFRRGAAAGLAATASEPRPLPGSEPRPLPAPSQRPASSNLQRMSMPLPSVPTGTVGVLRPNG